MAKRLLFLISFIILFFTSDTFAQFPYAESFKFSTARGIVFGGAPQAYLTALKGDPEGNGFLRLTSNGINQKGYIYSDAVLPSLFGLKVEFEYYTYGGSGADGISFFLFDAGADPFNIGGFGGSLGYAQITTTNPVSPGVSKGYVAIGLDEWGNFSNPIEGRQGGISGLRKGSVTLRGKGDGAALTPDNYKYLTSIQTIDKGFILAGNKRDTVETSPAYRKVFIELVPLPGNGYSITVKIKAGSQNVVTVIDKYEYTEEAPPLLRYGIASSTGASTNFHEIRNVSIDVSNTGNLINPTALSDLMTVCPGESGSIDVTANDFAKNPGATINKESIDLNPSTPEPDKSYTVAGKGTFSVDNDGIVSFTPVNNTILGDVAIQYTVKDAYGALSNASPITARSTPTSFVANAGVDQTLNVNSGSASINLNGNLSASKNSKWTQISGPTTAIVSNAFLNNTTASNLLPGTYVFRWTISPGTPCQSFDDVQITITAIPPPKIGLAKEVIDVQKGVNGSFNLTYKFTLANLGEVGLEKITLLDNLTSVFNGTEFKVREIRATGGLKSNKAFDGDRSVNLLESSSRLDVGETARVELDLNILPLTIDGMFTNSAFSEAYSVADGEKATDLSTAGPVPDPLIPGDPGPSSPTPVELKKSPVFIPEGFSPNNDGRYDTFQIYNTFEKKIGLEIYNRWGNRVYKSADYQNNWDGRCTEGMCIGEDVPAGTYYYVVLLDNTEKYSGFITINR